jgi:membrane carboxypeptidase/penicillin-binding protein
MKSIKVHEGGISCLRKMQMKLIIEYEKKFGYDHMVRVLSMQLGTQAVIDLLIEARWQERIHYGVGYRIE